MKRLAAILTLVMTVLSATAAIVPFPVQDNETIDLTGDSLLQDGEGTSPQTGNMASDYFLVTFFLLHPEFTNFAGFNFGQSGSTMAGQAVVEADQVIGTFAFNAARGFGTNQTKNVHLGQATDNGALTSNDMFYAESNNFLFPGTLTNGTANTNEGGWCATNFVHHYGFAESSWDNSNTGSQSDFARNNAITNAGALFGSGYGDIYNERLPWWTNYNAVYVGVSSALTVTNGPKAGHFTPNGELSWCFGWWRAFITDTNISSLAVDYTAGTVTSTNWCVVNSIAKSGGGISFVKHALRFPPGWDVSGSVDWLGNVTTNDCSDAYLRVNTNDANFWQDTVTVTGLPAGTYNVVISNTTIATVTGSTLAAGLNTACITKGPIWQKRVETLGRYRDVSFVNRTNLIQGSSGAGIGVAGYSGLCASLWPAHHGDSMIQNVTNYLWNLRTNTTASFDAVRSAAQPQDFLIEVIPLQPTANVTTATMGTVHWGQ